MDELTRAVLEDLKATFDKKRLLSPADIAPILGKSEAVLANLRSKKKSPLEPVSIGGSIGYSIYHLAEFLAHGKVTRGSLPDEPSVGDNVQTTPAKKKRGRPRIQGKYDHLMQWRNEATFRFESAKLEIELIDELERAFGINRP